MDHLYPTTIYWETAQGRVLIGITHVKSDRRGYHRLEIRALDPENATLPLGGANVHESLYRAADIRKAGGPARFAEQLILAASRRIGAPTPPVRAPQKASAPHPLEAELAQSKTYTLPWNSPTGPVTLTISHTKTFFNRAHVVAITVPPDTPFPLDTLSYIVTDLDLQRAGSAKAFVESLIAAAEGTASWRQYAARAAQTDLFAASGSHDAPTRSRPGRHRLKLSTPRR